MATPSSAEPLAAHPWGALLVRCALGAVALGAIAWGVVCLPTFLDQMRLEATQNRILRNYPMNQDAMASLSPLLDRAAARADCVPVIHRSAAVVRLRFAEIAFTPELHQQIDERMKALDGAIRKALSCEPTDPYLWLVLFWTKNTREGYKFSNFDLLRMSYRLGPNEGWIVPKRGQLALMWFDLLPPDLVDETLAEFARLVKSELYTEAIEILSGPGWRLRDRLMGSLQSVPPRNVAILVKAMSDIGFDVGDKSKSGPRG